MTLITDGMQMARQETEWTSSKGNQNKWFADGMWYKEDGLGYEALAEIFVSRLLAKTNAGSFVSYEYKQLERDGRSYHGCGSADFLLPEDDKLISVERLFQAYKGESAARGIVQFETVEERIRYIVENMEEITGLNGFGNYLKKVLTVDALFSDTRSDYPLELNTEACYQKIQAKPFSRTFDEQLDACEVLYGGFQFHAFFTMKDVVFLLEEFQGIYEDRILSRVCQVMRQQIRKYAYLF